MARAKTARQIAASRKNIKKAQIVSARKRRGTGKARPKKGMRHVAVSASAHQNAMKNSAEYRAIMARVAARGGGNPHGNPNLLIVRTASKKSKGKRGNVALRSAKASAKRMWKNKTVRYSLIGIAGGMAVANIASGRVQNNAKKLDATMEKHRAITKHNMGVIQRNLNRVEARNRTLMKALSPNNVKKAVGHKRRFHVAGLN